MLAHTFWLNRGQLVPDTEWAGGRCLGWGYGSTAHARAACLLSSRKAVGGCTDTVTGQEFRAAATTEKAARRCAQTTWLSLGQTTNGVEKQENAQHYWEISITRWSLETDKDNLLIYFLGDIPFNQVNNEDNGMYLIWFISDGWYNV